MDHERFRTMVSASLDGELTPAEQQELAAHLAQCAACRELLRELAQTQRHVRGLGPVTPPPWLTARIMAQVRAESRYHSGWSRRLWAQRRWLPLEAAALVILCVTGYLLYRAVATDPSALLPRTTTGRSVSAPAPQAEFRPGEEPAVAGTVAEPVRPDAAVGRARPGVETPQAARREHAPVSEDSAVMPPPLSGSGTATAAPESLLDGERGRAEHKAAPAPQQTEILRAPALGSALREKREAAEINVLLTVSQRQAAVSGIRALVRDLGGEVVTRQVMTAGEILSIRVNGDRLEKLVRGLERFGRLRESQVTPAPVEGAVLVRLTVVEAAGAAN